MKIKIQILSAFLIFTMAAPLAFAADVPARDSAGAEQERFQENVRREKEARNMEKRAQKEEIKQVEEEPVDNSGVTFVLKEVRFSGNEKFTSDQLRAVIADKIGKTVGLGNLKTMAARVKKFYRDKGYIAAYVYIPPQDVNSGIVEFQVIEGKLGNVEIKGNKYYSEKVLRRMARLTPGTILSYADLRRALAYFNKKQDLKVTSLLKPGREPKTTDLELDVKDKFPIHLGADVNNLGTNDTGKNRFGISLSDSNVFGLMDELSTHFQIGDGSVGVGTRYAVPLHSSGTTLALSHSYSHVHLKNDFKPLDIEGNANTYGVDLSQPFFSEQIYPEIFADLTANIGFDFKSIENTIMHNKAGHDELRILNTGINSEFTDRWGKTFFPNSLHFGFSDFLGASNDPEPAATRAGTGGQFFVYRGSLIRYHRLPEDMILAIRSSWQASHDSLAPSEQLHLGGAFSIRGYQEGAYLADYGGFVATEIFIPTYFFPLDWKLPYSEEPLRKQIQGVAFFDFGAGALKDPLAGERDDRVMSGAGGGIRIHLFDRVYGRFQWAGRTGQRAGTNTRSAFYYGISAELF